MKYINTVVQTTIRYIIYMYVRVRARERVCVCVCIHVS